ncbi:molybdopterin-dependent oxidoreductase [Vibrio salinus]|uniref:molybdopterin-dependent oxidoreductase n=1 Tax=Vibrio salinus TaxID=2899784 RepID=UPI001E2EB6C9|nr:molybdopterin-dependent oxidoreductase [Vibrio salinus]MCE0495690.1 hypothetical protein [Vibrio salinus]
MRIHFFLFLILSSILLPDLAAAGPGDKTIRFSGDAIKAEYSKRLTIKTLEQNLPLVTITAYNPWDEKTEDYTGFWLNIMAKKLGTPDVQSILLTGLDGYQVSFNRNEWLSDKILLATKVNGSYISVREKGPLRVIFSEFDKNNAEDGLKLPKWMWMITRVEFRTEAGSE